MPKDEPSPRLSRGEQRKAGSAKFDDLLDTDVYAEVPVGPSRGSRKSTPAPSRAGKNAADESATMEVSGDTPFTEPPLRICAFLFPRSSWTAQAFQYTLSEGGMALMTAFILFLLCVAGMVTMYGIAPSRTSGVAQQLSELLSSTTDGAEETSLSNVVPDVLTLLQTGLQFMLIPALLVGMLGIFVLSSADRRRPGYGLVGYGCVAIVVGLALLYLLLRVAFSGRLTGLEKSMNQSLYEVWGALDDEAGPCRWESTFACSGFHYCCVTNTTPLIDEGDNVTLSAAWSSLCFVTLPNGTAILQNGADVSAVVQVQCGVARSTEEPDKHTELFGTPCALSSRSADATLLLDKTRLVTCENYVLGQLTSTLAFALCLTLGMTVCSLVSGVVAVISSFQRTRTSDFVMLNTPAAVVNENATSTKGKK